MAAMGLVIVGNIFYCQVCPAQPADTPEWLLKNCVMCNKVILSNQALLKYVPDIRAYVVEYDCGLIQTYSWLFGAIGSDAAEVISLLSLLFLISFVVSSV